jgi:hypothetical protein
MRRHSALLSPGAPDCWWDPDPPQRFTLENHNAELVVHPASAGTTGYDDLRRDATQVQLPEELEVTVASLVDLVRVAEGSEDRARVPALRRTLELATTPIQHFRTGWAGMRDGPATRSADSVKSRTSRLTAHAAPPWGVSTRAGRRRHPSEASDAYRRET